ncbi:hypothetical protein [Aporhodopirellula aestuarii]|uniref:Uncharacterized protein n=1 Tax=Aporhodopirellula aestuarii TaxID=2950107 RepID=A0ABT0UAR3_9BACT|nr:hypothetical protein [Aporhodopirellula aestuarii]MCM2373998.1 hypothetical protein [Aporhodopirellula aestuarii]
MTELIDFFANFEWMLSLVVILTQLVILFKQHFIERRETRLLTPIRIILQGPDSESPGQFVRLLLPYQPPRHQLSRGELQGILGLYHGKGRFDPKAMLSILENDSLEQVMSTTGPDELVVPWDQDPRIDFSAAIPNQPIAADDAKQTPEAEA